MVELTESQRKALIEAVAEHWHVSDAWDNILSENERKDAAAYFLAGVRWALEEIEARALASSDIAVNDHFIEDAIVPLRAQAGEAR